MERQPAGTTAVFKYVMAAALTLVSMSPKASQACCFSRWFGRNNQSQTAYYVPAATAPAAAAGANCGPAQCQQTVLRYVPQVSYRTVWQPIPVTTYRRSVSTNPATGLPITCTQPCTTYTYQARRVPYTSYRPVYSQEPVNLANYTTQYAAAAPSTCSACTGTTTTAPQATQQQPYYSTPGSTSAPVQGATPWEPVQPTQPSTPSSQYPYSQPTPSSGTDPAESRPSISPSIDPATPDLGARRNPPSIRRDYASNSADSNASGQRTEAASPAKATEWTTIRPSYGDSTSRNGSGSSDTQTNGTRTISPSTTNSTRSTTGTPSYDVRPLPYLQPPVQPTIRNQPSIPSRSSDPRDRTASIRPIPTRWASNRIEWPEQRASYDASLELPQASRDATVTTPRRHGSRRLDARRIESGHNTTTTFTSDGPAGQGQPESGGWRHSR